MAKPSSQRMPRETKKVDLIVGSTGKRRKRKSTTPSKGEGVEEDVEG